MDFDFPPDDDPRRLAVRSWIENNPNPSAQDLVDAGYVVPHWPRPYGLEAEPMLQIIISDELRKAKIGLPPNPIGIGWQKNRKKSIYQGCSQLKISGVNSLANLIQDRISRICRLAQ